MFEHWLGEALPDEAGVLPAGGSLSRRRRVVLELELPGHGLEFAVTGLAGADLLRALTAAAEGGRLSPDELLWAARGWQKLIGFAQAQQHQVLGWFALAAMPAGFRDDLVAGSVGGPRLAVQPTPQDEDTDPDTDAVTVSPGDAGDVGAAAMDAARRERDGAAWVLGAQDCSAHEVALELGCSVRAAEVLLGESVELLTNLPDAWQALADGRISVPVARAIVTACEVLEPGLRHEVETIVLPGRHDKLDYPRTPAQMRAAARRAVARVDAAAARRRELAARRRRCVYTRPGGDGMGDLVANGTIAAVAEAFENVDAHARHLHTQPGEERGLDAIRSDLALAALAGRLHLGAPGFTPPPCTGEPDDVPAHARPVPRLRAEIVLTGADTTLAGLDDEPAEVAGYGPISAHTFRELATRAQTVHALTTDPATGTVTTVTTVTTVPTTRMAGGGHDVRGGSVATRARQLAQAARLAAAGAVPPAKCTGYAPSTALARLVMARDRTCRLPGCRRRADRCDLDHTTRYPRRPDHRPQPRRPVPTPPPAQAHPRLATDPTPPRRIRLDHTHRPHLHRRTTRPPRPRLTVSTKVAERVRLRQLAR